MDDEEDLECPVCTEVYDHDSRTPMMMPCLHSVCASCVADLVSFASPEQREERLGQGEGHEPVIPKGRVVRCPLCRDDFNTDRLQTNRYILAHLRDLARLEALQAMKRWEELSQEPHTAEGQPLPTPPPQVLPTQVPPPVPSPSHRVLSRRKAFVRLRRPGQPPPPVPTQPPPPSDPQQVPPTPSPRQAPPTPNPQQEPPTPSPRQAPPTPNPQQVPPTPSPRQAPPTPNPQQVPPTPSPRQAPPIPNPRQSPHTPNPQQPSPASDPQQPPPSSTTHQSLSASYPLHSSPASTPQQPPPNPSPQRPSTPPKSKQAPPPPSPLHQEQSNQLTPPGRLYPTLEDLPDTFTSPQLPLSPSSSTQPHPLPSNKGLPSASNVCATPLPPSAPSAPPSRDVLDDMWCRTCEEPARGNACAKHHLTPLLKEEEITWIEQRQQRDKQQRKQEKQQMKQQRKQQKQQQQQERKDWKLAVKLANTSLKAAEKTSLPQPAEPTRTARVGISEGGCGRPEETVGGSGRTEETVGGSGRPEDLSNWSYKQILHAINTSCDLEFLQVCHREFDRRRQEYRRTIRRRKGHRGRPKIVP